MLFFVNCTYICIYLFSHFLYFFFRPEVIKIAEFPSYVRELHDNNNAKFAEGFRVSISC